MGNLKKTFVSVSNPKLIHSKSIITYVTEH